LAASRASRVLQPHGGIVQQLGEDAACERLDRVALARVEALETRAVVLELGAPQHLCPLAERDDGGHRATGGDVFGMTRHLLGDDGPPLRAPPSTVTEA